jgi:DNA processing protein
MGDGNLFWVALHLVPGVGPSRFKKLIEKFGDPSLIFKQKGDELSKIVGERVSREILSFPIEKAEQEMEKAQRMGIRIINYTEDDYPEVLKYYDYSPPLLYIKGSLKKIQSEAFAIVGTRRATPYGRLQARKFARELAEQGFLIVSGGARGVDTEAHLGALDVDGKTVAVFGSGLDVIYPPENGKLFERICERGALISEYPLGTLPLPENFPKRNRIISALSMGILVIEAGERSGALHTAEWGLEQGKEVFALPGPISSKMSKGTNRLIQEGAKLVTDIRDILEEFGYETPRRMNEAQTKLSPEEFNIYQLLSTEPCHIDDLVREMDEKPQDILKILLNLELKGFVRQLPGKFFVREY